MRSGSGRERRSEDLARRRDIVRGRRRIVDGDAYAGMIDRAVLPDDAPGDQPAVLYARRDLATVTPDDPIAVALERLDAAGSLRLAVVDSDGSTLRGLLCLNGTATGFCG